MVSLKERLCPLISLSPNPSHLSMEFNNDSLQQATRQTGIDRETGRWIDTLLIPRTSLGGPHMEIRVTVPSRGGCEKKTWQPTSAIFDCATGRGASGASLRHETTGGERHATTGRHRTGSHSNGPNRPDRTGPDRPLRPGAP